MHTNPEEDQLLYRDEVYQIVGAAMEVRNALGFGFLEAVYQEALALECRLRNIPVAEQVQIPIHYKTTTLKKFYIADITAFGKIIVELKSLPQLTPLEDALLLNYLRASGYRIGLLFNFGHKERLEWKRLIF